MCRWRKLSRPGLHAALVRVVTDSRVWECYSKVRLLGSGSSGTVHLATHGKSRAMVAVKTIAVDTLTPSQLTELRNEIASLQLVSAVLLLPTYDPSLVTYLRRRNSTAPGFKQPRRGRICCVAIAIVFAVFSLSRRPCGCTVLTRVTH